VNALLEVVPVPRHLLARRPPAEMRNAPFGRNPVGNGFYRFGSWTAGQSLTLDGRTRRSRTAARPSIASSCASSRT
jgi:hypothetical protein